MSRMFLDPETYVDVLCWGGYEPSQEDDIGFWCLYWIIVYITGAVWIKRHDDRWPKFFESSFVFTPADKSKF